MCGIAGIYTPTPTPEERLTVARMLERVRHRGPDDLHLVETPHGVFGATRLSILDLEGGRQPIWNEDQTVLAMQNGEIYNYPQLKSELEAKGHLFRTRCDTEVLSHLYEEHGHAMLHRLRGMFALAVYDKKKGSLLLARDRLGIKPLFLAKCGKRLLFCSELSPLARELGGLELDEMALSLYFHFLYIPAPMTVDQRVRKLLPGQWLEASPQGTRERSYFQVGEDACLREPARGAARRLEVLLQEAVESHLLSDVPVGVFLSGGIDSSLVAALVANKNPGLPTFTIGFQEAAFDERPFARSVARHIGSEHHEEVLSAKVLDKLDKLISHFGEPFGDSSLIPTYLVSQYASKHVKVVLSGDGGDEIFGGYTWLRKALFVEKARPFLPQRGKKPMPEGVGASFPDRLRRLAWDASSSPEQAFLRIRSAIPWPLLERLLHLDLRARLAQHSVTEWVKEQVKPQEGIPSLLRFDLTTYLPEDILTKVDRMAMANSLEVRPPLLDIPLVQYAHALPLRGKLSLFRTKRLIKEMAASYLPPDVLRQRKQGFAPPLSEWFRGEYQEMARERLLGSGCLAALGLRRAALEGMLASHQEARQDYAYPIFGLMALEAFLRLSKL